MSVAGDIIYGRVMVDPVQNLGDSFYCYVPKYNPTNAEYGCLADSPSLLYRFKIVVSALTQTMHQIRQSRLFLSSILKQKHLLKMKPNGDLLW